MKKHLYPTLFAAVLTALLAGCATGRTDKPAITVSPALCVLTPDSTDRAEIDLTFHVPSGYLSRRSRLIVVPQLVVDDSVRDELTPIVLDAPIYDKKKHRMMVLEGYADPYAARAKAVARTSASFDVPYRETVQLAPGTDNARIMGVVTTDGCGVCSATDTIEMASVSNPVTLMPEVTEALELNWIEPEFKIRPKVMEGKGVAHLQFVINRHDINLELGNNRSELEDMVNTLAPILQDTLATLTSLDIYGMASADGPLSLNTPLSRNRAEAAKQWLVRRLGISPAVQRIITVGSRPEGWQPVLDAMMADGHPDTTAVKAILEKYADSNDDVQERFIRRLPAWNQIRDRYLQKDRKVEYVYTYTLKSFTTDEELLEMYGKRPDAFNEEELLRVATLASGHEAKKEVYATLMKYFPQSQVAANNLAVLCLREGKTDEAQAVLSLLEEHTPEVLNTLAASYVYAGDYEHAIELLQDVELPEARYNLGLLKARQRRLREAYELLLPFADVNSAICALSVNENHEAKRVMEDMEENQTPLAEYVRSLVAARLKEDYNFRRHIAPACADKELRKRAAGEPDFYPYHEDEAFRTAVNKEEEEGSR